MDWQNPCFGCSQISLSENLPYNGKVVCNASTKKSSCDLQDSSSNEDFCLVGQCLVEGNTTTWIQIFILHFVNKFKSILYVWLF